MEFLKQSSLLRIEDVLPYFPDFCYVDDFKEEILEELDQYNTTIAKLKSEMNEATRSAEAIRVDIRKLRSK